MPNKKYLLMPENLSLDVDRGSSGSTAFLFFSSNSWVVSDSHFIAAEDSGAGGLE
jgi:hypothetical protein